MGIMDESWPFVSQFIKNWEDIIRHLGSNESYQAKELADENFKILLTLQARSLDRKEFLETALKEGKIEEMVIPSNIRPTIEKMRNVFDKRSREYTGLLRQYTEMQQKFNLTNTPTE